MNMSHLRLCCYFNMLACFPSETGTCICWIHLSNRINFFKSFNFFLSKCQSKPIRINLTDKQVKYIVGHCWQLIKMPKCSVLCALNQSCLKHWNRENLRDVGWDVSAASLCTVECIPPRSYVCPVYFGIFWPDPLPPCSRLSCWSPGTGKKKKKLKISNFQNWIVRIEFSKNSKN